MDNPVLAPIHTTVVGVFDTAAEARSAIEDLRRAGFSDARIGFITPQGEKSPPTEGTRWEEGAGVGAAIGASLGGTAGLIAAAATLSPLGPAVVGGAFAVWLASLGAGAAAGSVLGALIGMGIPEEESRWYEGELRAGRSLVTVSEADERAEEAREILRHHGGHAREPALVGTYGAGLPATPY